MALVNDERDGEGNEMDTHGKSLVESCRTVRPAPLEQPAFHLQIGLDARESERARRERSVARNVAQHPPSRPGVAPWGRVMEALRGTFEREPARAGV